MVLEASKAFVNSLRERVKEIKLKKSAEDALIHHALSVFSGLLSDNSSLDFYEVGDHKKGLSFSRIDFKTNDFGKFIKLFKLLIRKFDSRSKFYDLDDLKVFSVDLKPLKEITGRDSNQIIVEVYSPTKNNYRLRVKHPTEFCYCGMIHRKSRKWITWIWDNGLRILTLDRVDPFADQIIFEGELDDKRYLVKTELCENGFNYEIISIETV